MTAKSIVASIVPQGHTFNVESVLNIAQKAIDGDRNRQYQTEALITVVIGDTKVMEQIHAIFGPPLTSSYGCDKTETVWDSSIEDLETAKMRLKMLSSLGTVHAHLILKGLANAKPLDLVA